LLSLEPILECGPLDPSRYPQLSHLFGPQRDLSLKGTSQNAVSNPMKFPVVTLRSP
jgi:hypothetical protein